VVDEVGPARALPVEVLDGEVCPGLHCFERRLRPRSLFLAHQDNPNEDEVIVQCTDIALTSPAGNSPAR
jgi:hypothetical protein